VTLTLAIASGLCVLALSYRIVFSDYDDFCECMSYALQPDIYSWYKGDLGEDWWAEMRIFIWIAVSAAAGYGVHFPLSQIFGSV
jgi:hypothetical protein